MLSIGQHTRRSKPLYQIHKPQLQSIRPLQPRLIGKHRNGRAKRRKRVGSTPHSVTGSQPQEGKRRIEPGRPVATVARTTQAAAAGSSGAGCVTAAPANRSGGHPQRHSTRSLPSTFLPPMVHSMRRACYAPLVRLGVSHTCVSGRNRCRCRVPCTATSLPQPGTINPWITARNREPPASGFAIL